MAAPPGSASSHAHAQVGLGDDHASGDLHRRADGPSPRLPHSPSTPPIRVHSTWRRVRALVHRSTAASPGGRPRTCPVRARQIWIDPEFTEGDRTLYAAGPDALYRPPARESGAPDTFRSHHGDRRHAPPVFYATVAGKIHVSTDGGATWHDSALPGFQGEATAIAAAPGPARDRLRLVQRTSARPSRPTWGVAKTTDAGRHWEPVYDTRARRLAHRSLRRRLGRQPVRPRCGAA